MHTLLVQEQGDSDGLDATQESTTGDALDSLCVCFWSNFLIIMQSETFPGAYFAEFHVELMTQFRKVCLVQFACGI